MVGWGTLSSLQALKLSTGSIPHHRLKPYLGIAYHLAVNVGDTFQNITHGDDLLESTHIHRQLQTVLGFPEPTYLHHRCVCDETCKRIAKRDDARSIVQLREQGLTFQAVLDMANP